MTNIKFIKVSYGTTLYKKVVRLREQVLRTPLGLKFSDKDLETDKNEMIFVLTLDNQPVACVQARKLDSHTVKLRQMAVHPDFQALGLGKQLLSQTEKVLKTKNIKKIELNARKTGLKFYQKSGYDIYSDEFIEVGIPHFKMIKEITT